MNFTAFPITLVIIAMNVVCSLIGFSNRDFMAKMIMWPYGVKRHNQYYRFITSGFIHADYVHLFFNMFTFYFFGSTVEIYFNRYGLGGGVSYVILYFLALIVSDIPSYLRHKDQGNYQSLGASGAVSAIVFAAIIFNPWGGISLYGAIRISAFLYAVLYIVYCIYMGRRAGDNINHDAHLYGALFGFAFTLALIFALNQPMFSQLLEKFQHPSLFGTPPSAN